MESKSSPKAARSPFLAVSRTSWSNYGEQEEVEAPAEPQMAPLAQAQPEAAEAVADTLVP